MPGFDRTGPRGLGPMTGGGRGFCAPSLGNTGIAYRRRGFSGAYGEASPYLSTQAELELLKHEFALLQKELEVTEEKIRTMEEQKSN